MNNQTIIEIFEQQANACAKMNSPFTASLIRHLITALDTDTKTGSAIENWEGDPAADALALRLCGALHSIVLSNPSDPLAAIYPNGDHADYLNILTKGLRRHDDVLVKWLNLPPQTNETGRAAGLISGLLDIARDTSLPIHLCEIGASAGLNMQLDQFGYDFDGLHWGNANSRVQLKTEMRGIKPDLSGELNIASRIGCDISPVDIRDPTQQLRLRAYIWPDQPYRLARINGAIEIALENPPELLMMDAAKFIEEQLEQRESGKAFVLMHSVVWQYLPAIVQKKIEDALHLHGANANENNPIYWLRLEGFGGSDPAARLTIDKWPNHTHKMLARSCFHSSWIEFT